MKWYPGRGGSLGARKGISSRVHSLDLSDHRQGQPQLGAKIASIILYVAVGQRENRNKLLSAELGLG